jgi:glucokinase
MMSKGRVLLVDLDGQDMTIAFAPPGEPPRAHDVLPCRTLAELEAIVGARLETQGPERLVGAAFSAAGPVVDDAITTTHTGLRLSLAGLRQLTHTPKVHLLNDLAALAMGVPKLPNDHLIELSPGRIDSKAALAVIGVDRGLGVAGLVPLANDGWRAIPSEAGHIDSCAREEREIPVFQAIHERRGDTTAERLLSRVGLGDIYDALRTSRAEGPEQAGFVVTQARAGDPLAREAISIFSGALGAFARDIALTYAARGGVFISSPLLTDFGDLFDKAAFARRYLDAGSMSAFVQGTKVSAVVGRPILLGLSGLFTVSDRAYSPTEVAYLDC